MITMKQKRYFIGATVAALVVLAACGGGNDDNNGNVVGPAIATVEPFTNAVLGIVATTSDITEPVAIDAIALTQPDDSEPAVI